MCTFYPETYIGCRCELYRSHPHYCPHYTDTHQTHLYPATRPPWRTVLIIKQPDDNGVFTYVDGDDIIFRTLPRQYDQRLKGVGCNRHDYVLDFPDRSRFLPGWDCPYHKWRGGLKGKMDRCGGVEGYDGEKWARGLRGSEERQGCVLQ